MDIVMGLAAALCWGGTDFLVGINARSVGVRRAVFFSQAIGFAIFTLLMLATSGPVFEASANVLGLALLAAGLTMGGSLALSQAFAIGKVAMVAPLVTSYGAVTTLLSWISGERLGALTLIGLALCLMGVMLTAVSLGRQPDRSPSSLPAIAFALLAAFCYGVGFWLQGQYTLPVLGPSASLWLGYAVGLTALLVLNADRRALVARPGWRQGGLLLVASLLNLGGFSAFAVGAGSGSLAIVTVLSTLSGGIAALLAALLLRERLSPLQWLGVLTVLAGALVLHLKQH
ncbi:DMT family transporter [Serratia proteamaculans]|uniref:DMT family transporter n=1 Tax=Serratia proteamaculans TaxID=28151 RepID=UPI001F5C8062|nr:DMT family transporter [Serratia proteamaculans]